MAAPNPYQYLKHGVILCGKTFATFVETFNFLVNFARLMRGDGDGNLDGLIMVDRTIPERPVIRSRLNVQGLKRAVGSVPGCFEFRRENGLIVGFDNPFYMVGSRIYAAMNLRNFSSIAPNRIVALVVNISGSQPIASINQVASFSALQSLADNENYAVFPLYETDADGGVKSDLRNIPTIAAKEFAI